MALPFVRFVLVCLSMLWFPLDLGVVTVVKILWKLIISSYS